MGNIAMETCGSSKYRQEHGHTCADVERLVGLGLVHVVSDTEETWGPVEFLFAERPEVCATVNGKVVPLCIKCG